MRRVYSATIGLVLFSYMQHCCCVSVAAGAPEIQSGGRHTRRRYTYGTGASGRIATLLDVAQQSDEEAHYMLDSSRAIDRRENKRRNLRANENRDAADQNSRDGNHGNDLSDTAAAEGRSSASSGTNPDPSTKVMIASGCTESDGYTTIGEEDAEAMWVEFKYKVETPRYVSSFSGTDRVKAVESLVHQTLVTELLGCEDMVEEVGNGRKLRKSDLVQSRRRRLETEEVVVAGVNTSPTDVQKGTCQAKDTANECRIMQGFVIVFLWKDLIGNNGTNAGVAIAEKEVYGKTLRIIKLAMDRGDYDNQFVNNVYIASVSFLSGENNSDDEKEASKGAIVEREGSRKRMPTRSARIVIMFAGLGFVLFIVLFLSTKAYLDGRRRNATKPATDGSRPRQDTTPPTPTPAPTPAPAPAPPTPTCTDLTKNTNKAEVQKEQPSIETLEMSYKCAAPSYDASDTIATHSITKCTSSSTGVFT